MFKWMQKKVEESAQRNGFTKATVWFAIFFHIVAITSTLLLIYLIFTGNY